MRAALDDVSPRAGPLRAADQLRVRACACPRSPRWPGLERLDMMLNDSMYGILFRDINPLRTFVDQRFSRQVHARAGIIINTGEDNYLTTADAVEAAHTVIGQPAAQRVLRPRKPVSPTASSGSGTPSRSTRRCPTRSGWNSPTRSWPASLFPDAPLKWMPPTKHMTGDVFARIPARRVLQPGGAMTGQSILLVGMMTEGIHTPLLSDRDLALQNVRYVLAGGGPAGRELPAAARRLHRPAAPSRCSAEAVDLLRRIGGGRPARRDRRRHLRPDQAPRRRRQGSGRRVRAGRRLLQPGAVRGTRSSEGHPGPAAHDRSRGWPSR